MLVLTDLLPLIAFAGAVASPVAVFATMRQAQKGQEALTQARLDLLDQKIGALQTRMLDMHGDIKSDVGGILTEMKYYREERQQLRNAVDQLMAAYQATRTH